MVGMGRAVVVVVAVLCATVPLCRGDYDCQDIDSSTFQPPSSCPQEVSPSCPRCYTNTMDDYTDGDPTTPSQETITAMTEQLDIYMNLILTKRPPTFYDDGGVFQGTAGRALMFLKLYKKTSNTTFLHLAESYVNTSLIHLPQQKSNDKSRGFSGFLWSYVGTMAVSAVVKDMAGDRETCASLVRQIADVVRAKEGHYNDFDAGRAGLLFAVRFVKTNTDCAIISQSDVDSLATFVVDLGAKYYCSKTPYLQWGNPLDNGKWLGTSHGAAGVIHELLEVPGIISNTTALKLVTQTLDHIVDSQFPSGNFPSQYHSEDEDLLVQWDHGAPGISSTLATAFRVLLSPAPPPPALPHASMKGQTFIGNSTRYLDSLTKAQACAWERGLLTKGLMQCHGISGNIYSMLIAHRETGDKRFLYRASQFANFVMSHKQLHDIDLMRQVTAPQSPFDLWGGNFESFIMLMTDFVHGDIERASHTGFDPWL